MYLVFYSSAYGLAHFCERGTISLIIKVKSTAISVDYNSLHPTEEDKKKENFFSSFLVLPVILLTSMRLSSVLRNGRSLLPINNNKSSTEHVRC